MHNAIHKPLPVQAKFTAGVAQVVTACNCVVAKLIQPASIE